MTDEAIVAAVHAAWTDAFAPREPARLAALYTDDATLYGSTATLHRGRAGVHDYFAGLSERFLRVTFWPWAIVVPAPRVLAASGPVTFAIGSNGTVRDMPYRMTHVLVQRGARWLIAAHHASPAPGP